MIITELINEENYKYSSEERTLRKLLVDVDDAHGILIRLKSTMTIPRSLEDAFYRLTNELDKFVETNRSIQA